MNFAGCFVRRVTFCVRHGPLTLRSGAVMFTRLRFR